MSYDHWKQTEPYDPHNEDAPDDETRFACPCGREGCYGWSDDDANIKVGPTWYAADCTFGADRRLVMEGRELAARADVVRDDDFDQVRR